MWRGGGRLFEEFHVLRLGDGGENVIRVEVYHQGNGYLKFFFFYNCLSVTCHVSHSEEMIPNFCLCFSTFFSPSATGDHNAHS